MVKARARLSRRLIPAVAALLGGLAWSAGDGVETVQPIGLRQPAAVSLTEAGRIEQTILRLADGFDGEVGIAVTRLDAPWTVSVNGERRFPQQSVSKLWVSMAVLAAADRGELSLDESVTVTKADLSIFHQPLRKLVGEGSYTTTLRALMKGALQQSDNAANDALVRRVGGPFAVQVAIVGRNLDGVRFGPGERTMQAEAAGLTWRPEYSFGRAFWEDREALPVETRKAALEGYLADPSDGATPIGIVNGLGRLYRGELLSPEATSLMLDTMAGSVTGAGRLRGGLAPGWRILHKTGTGQVMGKLATGYNDVALLIAPDGRVYAVAVLIGSTRQPLGVRQELMSAVTRAITGAPEPEAAVGLEEPDEQ